MSIFSSSSLSDYSTVTEAQSPPVDIRRPNDMPLLPRDSLSPIPDLNSPHPMVTTPLIVTPVIITPSDRRSTRPPVEVPRIRRRRQAPVTRMVLSTIRRHRSLLSTGGIRIEETTPSAVRNQKIEKTSTAMELSEAQHDFELLFIEAIEKAEQKPVSISEFPSFIPEFCTGAKIREQNRVESITAATESLEMNGDACLTDILDALALLDTSMRQMTAETEMIDQVLEDCKKEKRKEEERWARVTELIKLIRQ